MFYVGRNAFNMFIRSKDIWNVFWWDKVILNKTFFLKKTPHGNFQFLAVAVTV